MSDATTDAATDAATDEDGVLEQAAQDVTEGAKKAATFVTRLGGAFTEGFSDGRARS